MAAGIQLLPHGLAKTEKKRVLLFMNEPANSFHQYLM
jgi:hypothetical protein